MRQDRIRTLATGVLLGLAIAACGGTGTPERPTPEAGDQLSMTRGPCFGTCPMYTVTVWGDGRVRFIGERFVEQTGEQSAVLDARAVAMLFAHADSIGFFRMPADITPANQSVCGSSWTDMPSAEITIVWADRVQTVNHYHGCPKAPETLAAFEARIDEVLGTERWIGAR